jgi:hypothetical protein
MIMGVIMCDALLQASHALGSAQDVCSGAAYVLAQPLRALNDQSIDRVLGAAVHGS